MTEDDLQARMSRFLRLGERILSNLHRMNLIASGNYILRVTGPRPEYARMEMHCTLGEAPGEVAATYMDVQYGSPEELSHDTTVRTWSRIADGEREVSVLLNNTGTVFVCTNLSRVYGVALANALAGACGLSDPDPERSDYARAVA